MIKFLVICCCSFLLLGVMEGHAQKDTSNQRYPTLLNNIDTKVLGSIQKKYASLERKLTAHSEKTLQRFQKKENKIRKKMAAKDSATNKQLAENTGSVYDGLLQKIHSPTSKINAGQLNEYLPRLDSLQTTLDFLEQTGSKLPGISTEKLKQVQAVSAQLKNLQAQLQSAADIKHFVKERKQLLTDELKKIGLANQLTNINKQVYYYNQQLLEYKTLINDPDKLSQRVLSLVRDNPAFKDFMSKNSFLSKLFPMPSGYGSLEALQGLQTRDVVQQQLTQSLGSAGGNAQQYLRQQVQAAQAELNTLKDKINNMGGSSSDLEIPDFKPNNQKTKSFWNRIEYGLNIQSQKTNAFLPTTSDIALTMGYKLNDKSTIGIGGGYKIGWGKNISNIKLTSQGLSLRTYVDIKLKGSIWISGGYEENYQHEFTKISELKDVNAWQKSGLIGLTKKYKVGKKNGNLQLLWDFLSYGQLPRTQALKFRVGYSF